MNIATLARPTTTENPTPMTPATTGGSSMPRKIWCHNLWLMVSLCRLAGWPAGAAIYTWNGTGVDSNWSTGGNWVGGNPPPNTGTHDVVFINSGATSTAAIADAAWGVSSLTFNNNLAAGGFTLSGSPLTLNGGTDLTVSNADRQKPVTIDNALVLTARSDISLTQAGTGGRIQTMLGGNISGTGSMRVAGISGGSETTVPELVMGGANTWTGNFFSSDEGINTGPGGLMVGGSSRNAYVRFASPTALPTGNGGDTAYLAALRQDNGQDYRRGYLFTGGATEQVYDPAANLKFLVGGRANSFPSRGVIGSTGGLARLEGTEVIVFAGNADRAMGMGLLVEDGTLTFGAASKPVLFQSAYRAADTDNGPTGAASTLSEVTTNSMQLVKLGTGTLVLGNVGYTQLDGSTDKTVKFAWQVSAGALRGLSNTDPAHTIANSLFPASGLVTPFAAIPAFAGGVYEIDNSSGNGSTFTAKLRAGGAADEISLAAGGGFSAFGNPVTVSLDTDAANDEILFNWYTHPTSMMVFGSTTANAKLTMTNPIDLRLSSGQREFRILDNPDSTADLIEFSGVIRNYNNGNGGLAGLNKTGAGTLILSGDNSYTGATTVAGGTLMLAGSGDLNQSSGITVDGVGARFISNSSVAVTAPVTVTQGTIGGTGTLATAIAVGANVIQSPGNSPGNQIHTEDLTWAGGGTYLWEIADVDAGAGLGWDLVTVNAPGDFLLTATSGSRFTIAITSLLQNDSAGPVHDFVGTGTYYWKILDTADPIVGFAADTFLLDTSAFLNPLSPKGTFELRLGSSVPTGDASEIWLTYYQVPEPASAILLGLAAMATLRRRR